MCAQRETIYWNTISLDCNAPHFLYRRDMCIKVSYVDERAAVFVVMRQTPLGVDEHQMEEISVFTIQDKIYTLPTHSKYFAAIDPLA